MDWGYAINAVLVLITSIREFKNGREIGSLVKDKSALVDKVNSLKRLTVAMGKNHELQNRHSTFLGKLARAHTPADIDRLCDEFQSEDSNTGEPTKTAIQRSDSKKTFPRPPKK